MVSEKTVNTFMIFLCWKISSVQPSAHLKTTGASAVFYSFPGEVCGELKMIFKYAF